MKPISQIYVFLIITALLVMVTGLNACGGGGGSSGDTGTIVLDMPFAYDLGTTNLELTSGTGTIYVSVGAFGAHFDPFSGDLLGDFKSNLIGFYAKDSSGLDELIGTGGNDDGICDMGESCGFFGGATGDVIRSRTPTYTAPMDATLVRVTLNEGPNGGYFDNVPHWEIELRLSGRFTLRIGHLGGISASLRDKILAATGIDTDVYLGPPATILNNAAISVSAGEALVFPQVAASEIPNHPGYYHGLGAVPWAQMEFNIIDHVEGSDVCIYDLMEPTRKSAIQAIMDADMTNIDSPRFSPYASTQWVWGAQGVLCTVYSANPRGFNSIHDRVGGWTERPEAGTTVSELFAIVKMHKDAVTYSVSNYDSADVDHLISRSVGPSPVPFDWLMPDATIVHPFYPVGEVLEETTDSLLIKWRDIGWTGPVYQRAMFLLDSQGLKVKWGDFAADRISAIQPTLTAGEVCDDTTVLCYDHESRL